MMTIADRCKLDRYFGTAIAAVLCFAFALKAFISDPDFHQLGIVGSSAAGNSALDILIGHCLSDFLYQRMVDGTFGSIRNKEHHIALICGAAVTHNLFHRLAVYRFIHHITLPFVVVFDLMRKSNYNVSSGLFKYVMRSNLLVYFLFRIVVIPFHWIWYLYVLFTTQKQWSEIWPLAWPVLIACSILIDWVNFKWGMAMIKTYQAEMKKVV